MTAVPRITGHESGYTHVPGGVMASLRPRLGGTMHKQALVVAVAAIVLGVAVFVPRQLGGIGSGDIGDRVPWTGPVPKPHCLPGDHTESGLQGQTTAQERFGGDSERGYNCNLEL